MVLDTSYMAPDRGFFTHTLAADWTDGLLLGNGTMGAIVMGRPHKECIMVSHEELFLPLFEQLPVLEMSGMLPELRKLLRAGLGHEANRLVVETARRAGYPEDFLMTDPFHPGCDLLVDTGPDGEVTDYRRGVDFATGEAFVRYTDAKGGRWLQRGFVSRADGVLVMEWQCDRAFEAEVRLGLRPHKMDPWEAGVTSPGCVPKGSFVQHGLRSLAIEPDGSCVLFRAAYAMTEGGWEGIAHVGGEGCTAGICGNGLRVRSGGRMLVVAALDPLKESAGSNLPALKEKLASLPSDYASLLAGHAARHGDLFSRVRLELADTGEAKDVPVEIHLERARAGEVDPAWMQKVFDACRYNVISSSGVLPPNLQGVWTGTWTPHWSGDYTLDANVQAAVAHTLACGTPELMLGLFRLLDRMLPDFRENARALYGARGLFVNSRVSRHGLQQRYNFCPMFFWTAGGAWLAHYYYDYYLYTGDREFLRNRALPFMREAALFFRGFLVKDGSGRYEFNPSVSPENRPANGDSLATINATMDIAALRELLANLIAACADLGLDDAGLPAWREMLDNLPPYLANADGALREWTTPALDDNYEHRHMSHLYPLYPGGEVTEDGNPGLYEMCRRAVAMRMRHYNPAEYSAFGLYHLAMAAARTGDAATASDALTRLCGWHVYTGMGTAHDHGPHIFNMDASGGFPAAVAEMLLQSHRIAGGGVQTMLLRLLPALPAFWPKGRVTGLLARGGIGVDIEWENGALRKAVLRARCDVRCRVRCGKDEASLRLAAGESACFGRELVLESLERQIA